MKPEDSSTATFVTFYSFKGGVGRSMALINTAGILAGRRGFRVLVLDLDLEAPGLTYLHPESPDADPTEHPQEVPPQLGFVDLLTDALNDGEAADLFQLSGEALEQKYTREIHLPNPLREFADGTLHLMPAGLMDQDYSRRLEAINLNSLYREGLGEPLIRAFKKKLAESGRYDYVLVDSRTGISEGAGVCTRDLADHVMILSGLNRQNVEGTCRFLHEFRAATEGKKKFQIILSPMPNGEDALQEKRREEAKRRFSNVWGDKINLALEIPYHPQLALTEEPHIFRRRRGYLFDAYRRIEQRLLAELGHDARKFQQRITDSLEAGQYLVALRDLNHLIRLDRGQAALSSVAMQLAIPQDFQRVGETTLSLLEKLIGDENGCRVVEFVLQNLSTEEVARLSRPLLQQLDKYPRDLDRLLLSRISESATGNADKLCSYALFLKNRERFEEAEVFYLRALDADPKHAVNLGNYALFLKNRERFEEAEVFYLRALDADPKHAGILGDYAVLLVSRERFEEAETFYLRALDADPKHADSLANYGQLLAGAGRLDESMKMLCQAVKHLDSTSNGNSAEFYYSLWLVRRMLGHDAGESERQFKVLIEQGFKRHRWSFDRMLQQAEQRLSTDELEYARALAEAFLDEKKVNELAKFPQWQELQPLDPASSRISTVDDDRGDQRNKG